MATGVSLDDPNLSNRLSKSDTLEKIEFEASVTRGVQAVFKKQDDFVIWGPASVEIVDKEGDKISVEALGKALPQLLRRARLSLEHTDQIVGRILERFETEEPVTVEINGNTYERTEFPTDVLDLDDGDPPALFVAGEVFNDTQQSKRARKRIEDGELTSYSISGEALVTRKKVDSGTVYDDILDLDLSAVTLCEEGMNQGAAYSKVEGELSGKDLAGEATDEDVAKRSEIPVLEHPTTQGVTAKSGAAADNAHGTETKTMSDNEQDNETPTDEKSDGASLDDILKRLPDEGELATKEDVSKEAQKAVDDALPEGDLATVDATKSIVEDEVGAQVNQYKMEDIDVDTKSLAGLVAGGLEASAEDAEEHLQRSVEPAVVGAMWSDLNSTRKAVEEAESLDDFAETFKQEYGPDMADVDDPNGSDSPANSYNEEAGDVNQAGDGEPGAAADDEGNTTRGSGEPNQGNDTQDHSGTDTTSSKDDDDDVPEEFVDDDDDEDETEKSDSVASARDKIAQEFGVETEKVNNVLNEFLNGEEKDDHEDEEMDVDEPEEDEEVVDDDGGEDDYERMMDVLEQSLPSDVYEVVRQYLGDDISREDAQKIAAAAEASDEDDDLGKAVSDVLEGGAEVQGGTAIPTDTQDSQVDKQYTGTEKSGGDESTAESPALSNFY